MEGAGGGSGGGGDETDDEDEPASVPGTDNLLSLLVVLVARARPARAVSLAAYMAAFRALIGTAHKGELGFALANFLGAVQYIRSEPMAALLRCAARALVTRVGWHPFFARGVGRPL